MTVIDEAVSVMDRAKQEILSLRRQVSDLRQCVEMALGDAQTSLYLLPASDSYDVSAKKDILSAQIGRYRAALDRYA